MLPKTKKVLKWFGEHNVKAVVRLNDQLYPDEMFSQQGIEVFNMEFDDGSNPTEEFVRKFISCADGIIERGGKVSSGNISIESEEMSS